MKAYRVQFMNPATGRGFIDGYNRARDAKAAVKAFNALYFKDGRQGIAAHYLGTTLSPKQVLTAADFNNATREFYIS